MTTLPSGEEKQAFVRSMFDAIAPRYDLVNKLMTFGLDARWRSRAITLLGLRQGALVLDLACGTGDLARELRERGYRSLGADLSAGMLRHASAGGAPLVEADAASLPIRAASLNGVVSGFAVRNFADLATVVTELGRVLAPRGRLSLLEVHEPSSPLLRAGHSVWFRKVIPRLGAVLSDGDAYRYLPQSVVYLPSREEMDAMLVGAGFSDVQRHHPSGGIVQILTATRVALRHREEAAA